MNSIHFLRALVALAALILPLAAFAATDRTVTRGTFTLEFHDLSGAADQAVADRMIETYFAVYPQLVADFNPAAPRRVVFSIDPAWTGIAATKDGRIAFNPDWVKRHPEDIDDVTHELMHVVQAIERPGQPLWLIEGTADYARAVYGVDNAGARWALPFPGPLSRYTEGYRATARFLLWAEQHGHPGLVRALLDAMRSGTYKERLWKKLTGSPLDALWADYLKASTPIVRVGPPPTPEKLEQARRLIEQLRAANAATGSTASPPGTASAPEPQR